VRARSLALLAVAALAGCGGGGGKKIPESALPRLVLQAADLPKVFVRFDAGRLAPRDLSPPRTDPERFGRAGGWKTRYRRAGSAATRGPLVVQSTADVFDSTGGAKDDLAAYGAGFDAAVREAGARLVRVPSVGSGSHVLIQRQPAAAGAVLFITVAWRDRNATASVLVEGFAKRISLHDALVLARRQERRIAAAS
jgi:hypothetical protein